MYKATCPRGAGKVDPGEGRLELSLKAQIPVHALFSGQLRQVFQVFAYTRPKTSALDGFVESVRYPQPLGRQRKCQNPLGSSTLRRQLLELSVEDVAPSVLSILRLQVRHQHQRLRCAPTKNLVHARFWPM